MARAGARPARATAAMPADAPDSVLAENEHGSYCVPRSCLHRPAARTVLEARVWEAETLDLVRGANPAGDVVHAGTFFGDFIPALARSRGDGALVWAFEPNRESYRCARATISLNGLENVLLRNAGLDTASGSALLATSDTNGVPLGGASRVIRDPARARWTDSEQIALVAVDDVVGEDRDVAAIQLDVEGHEQEALAGALRTIARCRPLLVLETAPPASWIEEHLAPLGYRVAGEVNENVVVRSD
ncbi:MAG TPA: FkbM family methyltransferase [Solirubrobacteraceae bacterium]|nr:FkbM family methyltransferase [Solirubrobacteraceae bacterium]